MGIPEQLKEIAIQRRSMESEKWQKERLYADMERCKGTPRACGVGIWRAWTTAEREGTMDEFYKSHKN